MTELCQEFAQLSLLAIDKQLTTEQVEQLNNHVAACQSCRHRKEASVAFSELITEESPPDTLVSGTLYRISVEPISQRRWRNFLPKNYTVAAACLALVILYTVFDANKEQPLPPTTDVLQGEQSPSLDAGTFFAEDSTAGIIADAGITAENESTIREYKSSTVSPNAPADYELNVDDSYCGFLFFSNELPPELSSKTGIYISENEAHYVVSKYEFSNMLTLYPENVFNQTNFELSAENGLVIVYID